MMNNLKTALHFSAKTSNTAISFLLLFLFCIETITLHAQDAFVKPTMYFGDTSRTGIPFAKDPYVIKFQGNYLMYYSIPPYKNPNSAIKAWGIGIARSKDLTNWEKIGEIAPQEEYEIKGICAPSLLVKNNTVHIFYQTYGNGKNDAICHATSTDGISFTRDLSNPIFHPSGNWTCGRAIDAEVVLFNNRYLLFFATRDTAYKIQYQGVASAPINTTFARNEWTQLTNYPIIQPEYPWEGKCVEAASTIVQSDGLYMFYAGAYNNEPQQIGVAFSKDGIVWKKLSDQPFLSNGKSGTWNESESGHPHIFRDEDGRSWLFYQGNNTKGKIWYLSKKEVKWNNHLPYLVKE